MNFYAKNLMEKEIKHLEKLNKEISELEIEQTSIEARLATLKNERMAYTSKVMKFENWEIMDDTNAHNPMLVKAINSAWNDDESSKLFESIVVALMERDADEVEEKVGELQSVCDNWIDFLPEYLMRVADDWDLTTILHFVRWDIIFNKPTLGVK